MDFLHLFPPSSTDATADAESQLLFSAYQNLGLLCYSSAERNRLQLVVAVTSPSNQKMHQTATVLFKRISSIILSPDLPRNARFEHILVNTNGSRVALVGRRMVFVVELDSDFWLRHHPALSGSSDNVAHLRPEYYAKCDLLHLGLFVRKFPPSVVRVRWLDPGPSYPHLLSNALLAVLFSDNVIRIYDVSDAMDRPLIQLDFAALLPDRTPEESEASGDEFSRPHSTLGFITQLVSFDFGPLQISKKDDGSALCSVLALDSNGQIYSGLFPFDGIGFPPSTHGPLSVSRLPASNHLLCSALDLIHVRHPYDPKNLSLWALASEDGLLAHFVLTNQETYSAEGSSPFQLFVVDCVEISSQAPPKQQPHRTFITHNKQIARLQHEPGNRSAYFVVCQSDVFLVELSQLAEYLWSQCTERPKNQKVQTTVPQSIAHQLLIFADGESPNIGSLACLETVTAGDDNTRDPADQQQQLLAALCTFGGKTKRKPAFLAALLSRKSLAPEPLLIPHGQAVQQHPQQQKKHQQSLLLGDEVRAVLAQQRAVAVAEQRQLPQSLPAAVDFGAASTSTVAGAEGDDQIRELQQRAAQLTLVQQAVDQVLVRGQLPPRAIALDYAQRKASDLLGSLQAVERFREGATHRLTLVFRQLLDLKAQLRQRQAQLQLAEERVRRIAQSMQAAMFPSSSTEQQAVDTLKTMQQRLKTCAEETIKLDRRLRAHRNALCSGPAAVGQPQQQQPLAFISAPCALHASHLPTTAATTAPNAIPAQMFMLSKNGRECAKLRKMLQSLEAELNATNGR